MNDKKRLDCLVIEPRSAVMERVVAELIERGNGVASLAANDAPILRWEGVNEYRIESLSYDTELAWDVLVFDQPDFDERELLSRDMSQTKLLEGVRERACRFIETTRRLIPRQIFRGEGSFWNLELDDFFERYFDLPISPIAAQLRISCFRALCKEFARFNLQFNSIVYQPCEEFLGPGEYKTHREDLKVMCMKYRPPKTEHTVKAICDRLECVTAVVNGSTVHIGVSPNLNNY